MEKIYYYLPAVIIILAVIVTIVGIVVKLRIQQKMLKTKKVIYMNHTPAQELGIRVLFAISACYTIFIGLEGMAVLGDWYFFVFFFIGMIYFFVSIRDITLTKRLKK